MPREVFVDAGAWIAVAVDGDGYHRLAADAFRSLLNAGRPLVTTNLVAAETYSLIYRAGGHPRAQRFLRSIRDTPRLTKIYSDAEIEGHAEQILARYTDQAFSFVDAVSFAVMRDRGIDEAFAFDRHFATAGFTLVPGRG